MEIRRYRIALLAGGLLLAAQAAQAKPAYKKELADHFGMLLPVKLADCATCHASGRPGEEKLNLSLPKPHNAFGARLMAVGEALRKAGKRSDLGARLNAAAGEDTDRDGASNLVELLTGRQPGWSGDRPTAQEKSGAAKLVAHYRKLQAAYKWRPFEPVHAPPVPAVRDPRSAVRNPIDAFLAAEYAERALKPRPEAPKHVLLRRIYLDLTGLPPTREELQAFLADKSPDAYEKVVDRLLASPRYGERWGRHWMDVWRYSDWDGFGAEVRNSQPHMWRWRDWIIESLNADKPYDRMVQEMLAGDELAPEDPQTLRATGFLVRNWFRFNRNITLERTVEHTSKAFLGLTVNCARCHDHMYDPISQKEYYNFRAFFEPSDIRLDRLPGELDVNKDGLARIFDAKPKEETFLFIRGDDRHPDKSQPAAPAVPTALVGPRLAVQPIPLPPDAVKPDRREFVIREQLQAAQKHAAQAVQAAGEARRKFEAAEQEAARAAGSPSLAEKQAALAAARAAFELAEAGAASARTQHASLEATIAVENLEEQGKKGTPEWTAAAQKATAAQRQAALAEAAHTRLQAAAELRKTEAAANGTDAAAKAKAAGALEGVKKKLAEAEAAVAKAKEQAQLPASAEYTPRKLPVYPDTSTGRRMALARWITDRQNPLAARVAMNHIWLRHFGKGLVPTVFDFGRNGQPPTHPALLDWLAAEFMRQGWSMKRMHRLLVTSSAYRMDSDYDPENARTDPDNRFLWRMNPRRMEAEIVRDSVLHASGQLDLAMGGPELDQNQGLTTRRRSVYYRHSVEKNVEFLATFDQANVNECYERSESIMPQQALALANSELSIAQARVLAGSLWKLVEGRPEPHASRDFVAAAFQQVLTRSATAAELAECLRFLEEQAARLADPKALSPFDTGKANPVPPSSDARQRARESLVHVLLNHNDFVTIR